MIVPDLIKVIFLLQRACRTGLESRPRLKGFRSQIEHIKDGEGILHSFAQLNFVLFRDFSFNDFWVLRIKTL